MFNLIKDILFGFDSLPSTCLIEAKEDNLYHQGLTMGTLFIGKQGTGKTTALARHLVEYFKAFPDRAVFVLDWSGSITDSILTMILGEPLKSTYIKRIIYDQLGNEEWVVPMPEFSSLYGSYEEQVQRVVSNLARLSPHLIQNAPVLGGLAVSEIAPHFFRLLCAITNDEVDPTETWQITETKKLMVDRNLLKRMLSSYGSKVPETTWFLTHEYLSQDMKASEREMRTYALRSLLNLTDIREIKARLGYYRPGWTPKEAIEKGKLVLIDGAKLIGQEASQHYLFTQVFSLIMAEIKKRRPADPNDKPVSLILDEVYSLLSIPGMAVELSQLSPQYRSRKLQLYIVLQELAQMSEELRPHIWSLGNVVSFAMANFNEAYEISQQLFKYDPRLEKLSTPKGPMLENDRGQYLKIANWIQRLKQRECIIRRHITESQMESQLLHVTETKTSPTINQTSKTELESLKEVLLRERGIRVRDALEKINTRHYVEPQTRPTIEL